MNQNFNNNVTSPTTTSNNHEFILYGFMILAVVGCFLPFLTASAFGYSESINYVYAADSVKDGVYVIGLLIGAFFALRKKNYKSAIICIGLSLGVLAYDFIDIQSSMDELTGYGLIEVNYGIGFYIVAVGLVGALVMAIMISKKAPAVAPTNVNVTVSTNGQPIPQPMNNGVMNTAQQVQQAVPQQPMTCQYCGNVRNEGMFCKSCGGRY